MSKYLKEIVGHRYLCIDSPTEGELLDYKNYEIRHESDLFEKLHDIEYTDLRDAGWIYIDEDFYREVRDQLHRIISLENLKKNQ